MKKIYLRSASRVLCKISPLLLLIFVSSYSFAQVTIGAGVSTQRYPFAYYYGYSRTATIYSASEMNTISSSGTITTISWYSGSASTVVGPTVIYLKPVGTTTAVVSDTWANTVAGATQVYTGTPATWTVGWNTIDITDYNVAANQNLEILVECNQTGTGTGASDGTAFRYTTGAANSNAYWEQDNTAPTSTPTRNASRPNVILAGLIPPQAPSSCATNTAPANGATGLATPITLSWNTVASATSYTVFLGTNNPPIAADSLTTVGTNSYSITGGAPSTTYYWYVVPKNSGGSATGCSANITSFTTAPAPANDACTNAVSLNVSQGFCSSPVLGTLLYADSTTGLGAASCTASALKYDVWYKVVVPATGNITVQTSAVNTTVSDLVMQAYSGTCGSLTAIGCNDDGNPDPAPSANHPKLGLTGRTPGETIYLRVMPYSTITNAGAFAICAFDTTTSVMPAVAVGSANNCTNASNLIIDSAWKYTWVTFKDASNNVIGQVYPNGNLLGNTSASVYLNSGAPRQDAVGTYYLDRNFTITPTTQPSGSNSVGTRLYFKNTELTSFIAVAGATTRSQLNVSKTDQTCATSATAGTGATLLTQSSNGAYGVDHYVEVNNPSFSTFYLHKGATALPITFEYLKGKNAGTGNALNWKVNCTSASVTMVLERSADARKFDYTVTSITASQARCGQPFDVIDAAPLKGTNYYRLKMIDVDGKITYSPVVAVLYGKAGAELVGLYPTVVRNEAYLSVTASRTTKMQIAISDMSGKVIRTMTENVVAGSSVLTLNTSSIASGVYNITGMLDGIKTQTLRFIKE